MEINKDAVIQKLLAENANLTLINVQMQTILEQYQADEKQKVE